MLNNEAYALSQSGDHAGALRVYKQALQIKVDSFGEDSIQAALTRNAIGEECVRLGDLDRAETEFKHALRVREANKAGFDTAVTRENLAQVYEAKGDLKAAKALRITDMNEIACGYYKVGGPFVAD